MMDKGMIEVKVREALDSLEKLNPELVNKKQNKLKKTRSHKLQKVLIDNRGEIAKRFFLALHEEGIPSVAVVTDVDIGQSWYDFADEVVFIGEEQNYVNIPVIIAAALISGANALYAGYGFLSENPSFVQAIDISSKAFDKELIFMGPNYEVMRKMGDKVTARQLADKHDVPLFKSSEPFKEGATDAAIKAAERIGYPVIVKLSSGGGGKGMQVVHESDALVPAIESCCRIGNDLYQDSTYYLEKYIVRPIHIEVQVFNGRAVGIRKCAVQRRNQKIIEESGNTFLDDYLALSFLSSAERLAVISGYDGCGAGTCEFLIDSSTGKYGFMEMNTRLQVEYGVTDQSLSIDLVKWQILLFDGRTDEIVGLDSIKYQVLRRRHAIECRIYAEEPENDYLPSPGTILERDLPTFNGIRCDFGFGVGDKILPMYDPMIGKIIAHGANRKEAIIRLERALQEFYIKGVKTNINQLLKIIRHPKFCELDYTNNLLIENPSLSFTQPATLAEVVDLNDFFYFPILFGAFSEYLSLSNKASKDFKVMVSNSSILSSSVGVTIPFKYTVTYKNREFIVEFVTVSLDTFHAYINEHYCGRFTLGNFDESASDFVIIYQNSFKRVRIDRQLDGIVLRMRDKNNKVDYFRMSICPEGIATLDTKGIICSPFQGSFVSFCKDSLKVGAKVKSGDPIMILSAMKMETVIEAPCSGKITYIIENGDLAKLQLAKTLDGRIIGKSLGEGELLVKIEREVSDKEIKSDKKSIQVIPSRRYENHPMQILYAQDQFEQQVIAKIGYYFDSFLEVFSGCILGFINSPKVIDRLILLVGKISPEIWKENLTTITRTDAINRIILHYTHIIRLFSPTVSNEGFSYPEEITNFIRHWPNPEIELSSEIKALMKDLLSTYRIDNLEAHDPDKNLKIQKLFLLFKQSYLFCLEYWPKVSNNINITGNLNPSSGLTIVTLKRLLKHTQQKLDDSSTGFVKGVISKYFPDTSLDIFGNEEEKNIRGGFNRESKIALKKMCRKALSNLSEDEVIGGLQEPLAKLISDKFKVLKQRYRIQHLLTFSPESACYLLHSKVDNSKNYLGFTLCDFGTSDLSLEEASIEIAKLGHIIATFQDIEPGSKNRIEISLNSKNLFWDRLPDDNNYMNYQDLKQLTSKLSKYFHSKSLSSGIIETNMTNPESSITAKKSIIFHLKDDSLTFDLLHDSDQNSVYCTTPTPNPADQKLFNLGKWPIELWAHECFDPGSMKEIRIASIDDDPKRTKPIGSKIYHGKIGGKDACFYMKDFRVIGGATGDKEGLKYGAATYIAYLKGWPLFVWNDSAGANIKEGVVSLNRGGQGFMMNSLLAGNVNAEKFHRYTKNASDPTLRAIFNEINDKFGFMDDFIKKPKNSLIIAIGIGASAGLDVYGSSQATIQVVLDAQNSYRVLTGSNVIKSVLGENISNYDIGGAKILGKWTGTVDIVASDKFDLITKVLEIQKLFCTEEESSLAIDRTPKKATEKVNKYNSLVFDTAVIHNNVDDGNFYQFKADYYGSNALLGGFAKLGGKRVLIMGARTDWGITSNPAIIKARELLRLAQRTSTPQIIILGKKFLCASDIDAQSVTQSQIDLMNTLNPSSSSIRIHIIKDTLGLQETYLNNSADAIIFIKNSNMLPADLEFARMNSTFVVDSFNDAFDLANRLVDFVKPAKMTLSCKTSQTLPKIPTDKGEPYNIVDSVIKPTFDDDSFVEFYQDMNRPKGPNLITGLAKFHNATVGVIADQPEIKGGGADAPGAEKFRVFIEFLNKMHIPLVMLSNSSGFVPGAQQERLRIQAIGAESLDANILGEIPVVSVVLNQVYGGRQIQAFSKALRPGIVYIALEDALMAVMGETAAFDLLGAKKYNKLLTEGNMKEAQRFREEFKEDFQNKAKASNDAMQTGVLDWVIPDIKDLREHLTRGVVLAKERCDQIFANKSFQGMEDV